jgi:amino acid adenylation domain-containing protein/non-ribosomal peptide synthase protein (TIGR01720 family)
MYVTPTTHQVSTIGDLLRLQAERLPDQVALTFLEHGEVEGEGLTYSQMDRQARSIGAWLQAQGAAGQRVLLLHRPGLAYLTTFFGCLYAGAAAVPAYPPRNAQVLQSLAAMIADSGARFALTDDYVLPHLQATPLASMLRLHSSDQIDPALADQWQPPAVTPGDLAFLQYTSGSTGAPKGVMVTQGSLMHNTTAMVKVMGMGPADRQVSWLPLHHDLGLISGVFAPLCAGYPSWLMSPEAFLEQPMRWLRAVSRYRATTSGAPNFGYDLAVLKSTQEERAALDLSPWRVAFNGAEPIRTETLERFERAYGPAGFTRQAFCAGYGLAEATLIVSVGAPEGPTRTASVQREALEQNRVAPAEAGAPDAQVLVGCGTIVPDMRVIAVDPQTLTECPAGRVGELWVSGPSVAAGYWNRPDATEQTFRAFLAGTGEGPFLRTGDLGFVDADGELYITGRLKELIIIRGRNHYPQDIESTAMKAHPALMPAGAAAFSVTAEGGERMALACEVRPDFDGDAEAVFAAVRQGVSAVHELQVYALLLVKAGALPRTMSGKVQRLACGRSWQAGSLPVVAASVLDQPAPGVEGGASAAVPDRAAVLCAAPPERAALVTEGLRTLVGAVLKQPAAAIDPAVSLGALGLDSLAAVELSHQVSARYGVTLPMTFLLEGPTIAQVGARVAAEVAPAPVEAGPAARTGEGDFPVSHGQAAMWFMHRIAPESAAYNVARAARFTGADPDLFRRAMAKLVARHPALRTTFHEGPEGPFQRVHAYMQPSLTVEDATAWSEAEVQARLEAESQRPFDLERGPLLRWCLLKQADGVYAAHLNMHHIISDLWTASVYLAELGALLTGEAGGEAPALPALTALYTDYVQEQREMLTGPEGEKLKAYWQERLAGELPVLNLPADRPRPAVQSYRGATRNLRLSRDLSKAILTLGRKRGATPFATLLAAYQVLLHRYTGQEQMIIGSPTAGRSRREHGHVMGYYVNPVAIRADLSGSPSFDALLARVKETVHGALGHAAYPFPLLLDALQVERDPSRTPVYQAMFVLQRAHKHQDITSLALAEPGAVFHIGPMAVEGLPVQQQAAGCDLTLFMAEVDGELTASLEYNIDLFDAATAGRMLDHFVRLLEAIVADPALEVGRLPMLSAAEAEQVLHAWNDTAADYPREKLVHQLFEEQAERTPEAAAVALDGQTLTYAELNRRANRLAHRLQAMGVGPDVLVGVFMERHPLLLVGLLAIWKAGGAYLPVDPTYPRERVSYMLADAQAPVLLTQSHLVERLGEHSAAVICLDGDVPEGETAAASEADANLAPVATPESMAYVIYTSGSTGRPKGAMIAQRGLVNYLWWALHAYKVADGAGAPVHSSISFDLTVTSLWLPLLAGRRVELLPEAKGIEALGGALREPGGFSLVKITPAHMELIARQLPPEQAAQATRALVIGGEALQPAALAFWREHAPQTALINEYGPTETVVGCCVHWVEPDRPLTGSVPIGRPIANTQLYILDKYLQPVPVGVHGELYIGGDGVCRGYLNRPDLTEQRFLETAYGRIYKTGDLARWLPDGTIDFLGRIDEQVKVRGYRIELGEIETALASHPAVDRAAVVVRDDGANGSKRLVGYVVLKAQGGAGMVAGAAVATGAPDTARAAVEALKEHLRTSLPDYMVPTAFVVLEGLPLSPNGKVDRKALPAPEKVGSCDAAYVAPTTPAEQTLAAIWAELLGVERVSLSDNFFELGGDSILSIQVVSRAARAGWKLTPQHLFQHPTVAGLAAVAEPLAVGEVAEEAPMSGAVRLTPIQHWFLEGADAAPDHYNQVVLLQCKQPVNPGLMARALTHLAIHHDALRLRFKRTADGWEQWVAEPGAGVDVPVYPLTALTAKAAELQAGLSLTYGPLIKAALFQGETQRLLVAIHHLAVDGVSWRILLEDLQAVYLALEAGREPQLAPRTTSYQKWADALAAWQPHDQGYFLAHEPTPIPVDAAEGENTWGSARTVTVTLSSGETRALLGSVPAAYRTRIDDVLLTALARTLTGWTGRPQVTVNLEGHGREEIAPGLDLSRTVGWFTALYPVTMDLSGVTGQGCGEALKAVKEQLRAVPGKGLGYGVQRYLGGEAGLAAQPALAAHGDAQVCFNYLGQLGQVASGLFGWLATGAAGPTRSPLLPRRHLLEVDAMVAGNHLEVTWTYSANRHRAETIEELAEAFTAHLRVLIAHCTAPGAGGVTPSDFPLVRLTQPELDAALDEVGAAPGEVEEVLPLTPLQGAMLRHSLAAAGGGMYCVQLALELGGKLDPEAMARAWQTVVQRHPTLRTAFAWRAGAEPVQVVRRHLDLPMTRLQWQSDDECEWYLVEDRTRGFALDRAPLLRVALGQIGPDRYYLIFSIHHLLLDGWSNAILLKEVVAAYEALVAGAVPTLAPARPFRNYLQYLARAEKAEGYWQRTVTGVTAPTPLPADGSAGADDGGVPEVEVRVPADRLADLQRVARRERLTMPTLVQGAWAVLLARRSGADDVLFGAIVSGRPADLPDVETIVGPFINTLPVRVTLDADQSLAAFLTDLQVQAAEGRRYEHAAVPAEGLFDSVVVYENYPLTGVKGQGVLQLLSLRNLEQHHWGLTLMAIPDDGGLLLKLLFDRRRFAREAVAQVLHQLLTLLAAMPSHVGAPLGEWALLVPSEEMHAAD